MAKGILGHADGIARRCSSVMFPPQGIFRGWVNDTGNLRPEAELRQLRGQSRVAYLVMADAAQVDASPRDAESGTVINRIEYVGNPHVLASASIPIRAPDLNTWLAHRAAEGSSIHSAG